MFKKLPLGESPIIGYQHQAYPLKISSLHPSFWEWFCCNYIQIKCTPDIHSFSLNFYAFGPLSYRNPFLGEMYLPKDLITKYVDPLKFIREQLNNNHYIITFVDEFFIPHRMGYQKFHNVHDIMVYGYDTKQKIFHVAGYTENRVFELTEVSFSQFKKGFDIGVRNVHLGKWANGMHLLQLNLESSYTLDLNIIVDLMEDYLYSRNTSQRYRMHQDKDRLVFGIDTYDTVIQYLLMRNSSEDMDIRIFHTIYEHKKSMSIRIKLLQELTDIKFDTEIVSDFLSLEDQALIVRNFCLKYMINGDDQLINKMVKLLTQIQSQERQLWSLAIDRIKQQIPIGIA